MRNILCLVILGLVSCKPAEMQLGENLQVVALSGRTTAIIDQNSKFVVYPNIAEYEVFGQHVVGYRDEAQDNSFDLEQFTTGFGYFVLNTETLELEQGFTEEECKVHEICSRYF